MSPTVLVADDSRTIRKVVEMALKAAPFEVVGVGSAQEALEAVKRSPSVILLDYHLPDGSGFEVCRALKGNGSTSSIPIIMLGGNHRDFSEEQAQRAGADEVVMKPFNTDTLLDAIDAVADGKSAVAQPQAAQPEPVQPEPAQPEPAQPEPAQPEPAQPEPAQPEPAQPEPAQPEPAQPVHQAESTAGAPDATPTPVPSKPSTPSESRPRIPMEGQNNPRHPSPGQQDQGSNPRMRQPNKNNEPSQPRVRTDAESKPRTPDAGSQPRVPDADGGSQARSAGSQPRIATPDVNASSRAQDVSSAGAAPSAPGGTTSDSGVSNIGMSRAEIESAVKQEVKRSVKEQLPGLLRNIMGEVFQNKVLPKLLEHGEQRVDAIVNQRLGDQIQEAVRVEIERLLAEE